MDLIPKIPTIPEVQEGVYKFIQDRLGEDTASDSYFYMPKWLVLYLNEIETRMRDRGLTDEHMIVSYLCLSAFSVGIISEENNWDTSLLGVGNE